MCLECFFVTAAIGGFLGLLSTLATRTKRLTTALTDIGVGIAGAVPTAWFLSPLAANPASQHASAPEIVGALFGGVILLALLKAIRPSGR
jgi:uncharacterized membrane protein YeaQ/YmgE (transglycosylase-associated protein family)